MKKQYLSKNLVELDIDHNNAFDYEDAEKAKYTVNHLNSFLI